MSKSVALTPPAPEPLPVAANPENHHVPNETSRSSARAPQSTTKKIAKPATTEKHAKPATKPARPALAVSKPTRAVATSATLQPLKGPHERHLHHVQAVRSLRRNVAFGAAAFVGVMCVGIAVPAYAQSVEAASRPQLQTLAVAAGTTAVTAVPRDTYTVIELPKLVWPVPENTPVISGFGARAQGCDACSTMHEGVDLGAGNGAQVHAIAEGVVVETNNPGYSSLGVHVAIEHVIDGQKIVSAYAHLQEGSMTLKVGDIVSATQVIGLVGQTGVATAPHLHFEIRIDGTQYVDGRAWLLSKLG